MKRKFLSLVLALVMVLGTFSAVLAETTPLTTNDAKIQWLIDNKVVEGRKVNENDANDLALDSKITRAEVSKLLVYTLGEEKLADVLKGAIKVFPDVDLDHWANGYISVLATSRNEVASGRRVIIGYEDGYFRPNNDVTYAELSTMLVRIVKKDLTAEMEKNAKWATSYIRWAQELGILDGIKLVDSDAPAVRRDAFVMIYNAMHKLNLVGKNKVDWGIQIGIVSKLQAGKMEINQDPEKTYNLTYDTVVTNGTNWAEVGVNTVVPGSLVRFIADENGNVSHLLVVSVPDFGYEYPTNAPVAGALGYTGYHRTSADRIFDLGQKVAGAVKGEISFDKYYRPAANVTVTTNGQNPVGLTIPSSAKVFVADPGNNALKEVKSVTDAIETYNPIQGAKGYRGFVIYNTYKNYAGANLNEATVVVFTQVDKYHGEEQVLRVRYTPNSLYNVELENTKGEAVVKNLNKLAYLPGSFGLEQFDVVDLRTPVGATPGQLTNVRIDYSRDNVYRVMKIYDRYIVLRDEYNRDARIGMPTSTKVFLEGQLKVDAHVQIAKDATLDNVKIISVVNKPLKGALAFPAEDSTVERAWVSSVVENSAFYGYMQVTTYKIVNAPNGVVVQTEPKTYYVPNSEAVKPEAGKYYEFRVLNGAIYEGGMKIANNWKEVKAVAVEVSELQTALTNMKDQANYNKDVVDTEFDARYDMAKALLDAFNAASLDAKYQFLNANKTTPVNEIARANKEFKLLNDWIDANGLVKEKLSMLP